MLRTDTPLLRCSSRSSRSSLASCHVLPRAHIRALVQCRWFPSKPQLCHKRPTQLASQAAGHVSPTPAAGRAAKLSGLPACARTVRCQAASTAVSTTDAWWTQHGELWQQVHSAEEFDKEVLQASRPVVVEWFASWCGGCKRSYPEVCRVMLGNPDLCKTYKLVKVNIDDFPKAWSKDQGISALPRMSLYRPGQGRVLTWDIPVSRIKFLKQNLETASKHPHDLLALDPNGFFVSAGPMPSVTAAAQDASRKAAAIAELEGKSGSLFDRLTALAGLSSKPAGPSQQSAPPSTPPASTQSAAPSSNNIVRAPLTVAPAALPPSQQPQQQQAAPWQQAGVAVAGVAAAQAPTAEQYVDSYRQMYGADYSTARTRFLALYGSEYGYSGQIDHLYPQEVGVRMQPIPGSNHPQHYLDYTGSSVYTQSQLQAVFAELTASMLGNPHSLNPSSQLSAEKIDEVRDMVLKFFNADPAEWQLVFTRSATGALQLVGETFPWSSGSLFRYLVQNHNSVLGIREYALQAGGAFQAVTEEYVSDWLGAPVPGASQPATSAKDHAPVPQTDANGAAVSVLNGATTAAQTRGHHGDTDIPPGTIYSLFAFPAEDNFAGVKYPLDWCSHIKQRSTDTHKWMVLVDAAAYVPTQPLDLSTLPADFVDVSFYKLFGYPTGLGALLVRTEAVPLLHKVFWGGGSVALATSDSDFHVLKCRPSDKLEDGTVSFLDIISLKHGFAQLAQLGGIPKIQAHVHTLTEWLYQALSQLRHSNGQPVVQVFGKHHLPNHRMVQAGILNFNLRDPSGQPHSYKQFEQEAAQAGLHLRTGAECNPGACYTYLGVKEQEVESLAGLKEGCDDDVEFITVQRPAAAAEPTGQAVHSDETTRILSSAQRLSLGHPAEVATKWVHVPLGSVRASLGYMSTFEDVYALAHFIRTRWTDRPAQVPSEDASPVVRAPVAV